MIPLGGNKAGRGRGGVSAGRRGVGQRPQRRTRKEIVGLEPDEPATQSTSDENGGEKICSNIPSHKRKCPRTELDLSGLGKSQKEGNQVWLIKVPQTAYAAWVSNEPGEDIGKLVVNASEDGEEQYLVKVIGQNATAQGGRKVALPDYALSSMRPVEDTIVFTQSENGLQRGGGARLEAEVVRAYNMQPCSGDVYRSLMQQRLVAATMKGQHVKQMESKQVVKAQGRMISDTRAFEVAFKEREDARAMSVGNEEPTAAGARERMDGEMLRARLLELFDEQERWTFKDINMYVQQPEEHLKQALRGISELHRKGLYRNHYELKPEFRGVNKPPAVVP
eukprot:74647_1